MNHFLFILPILLFCYWGVKGQDISKPPSKEQMAYNYYQQRNFTKALPIFEELYNTRIGSNYYPYYLQCLIELKEFEKAKKTVETEMKRTPNQSRLQVDLGYVYMVSGKTDKAYRIFEEVIENLKKNPQDAASLGIAFRAKNLNEFALKTYAKGRELLKNPDAFQMEIASTYEASGDFHGMTEAFLDMLSTKPEQMSLIQSRLQFYLMQVPEKDNVDYLYGAILERMQKNPSIMVYSEMMYWFTMMAGDYPEALRVALSLVKRNNEDGGRLLAVARNCIETNDEKTAEKALSYIYDQGSAHPLFLTAAEELYKLKYRKLIKGEHKKNESPEVIAGQIEEILSQQGENMRTIELMRILARIYAYIMDRPEKALDILERAAGIRGLPPEILARINMDMAKVEVYIGRLWDAALIYGRLERDFPNHPLGEEAKLEYAKLMYQAGEHKWALLHLEILRGAIHKPVANDAQELYLFIQEALNEDTTGRILHYFGSSELLSIRKQYAMALRTLDSVSMFFGNSWGQDYALLRKARIYKEMREYNIADSIYSTLVRIFPRSLVADDALLELASLREITHQPEKAYKTYEDLILNYPNSYMVETARKKLQILQNVKTGLQ
ncbi:MAG: tetratricopeptide repeat protein [Bacteroidales bacterium]|jgi:tetratricopeptide (TPR) repeat protein|nr:tetratricopeptide repeat protein [Bacteroidales bacterium]